MDKKSNTKTSRLKFILTNMIVAVGVIGIILITLIMCLRNYTQHGHEVVVPDLTKMHIEEAKIIAAAEGLNIEVIDSTYSQKTPLGTIVEQTPQKGANVK